MQQLLLLNGSVRKQGTSKCFMEYIAEQLLKKGKAVRAIDLIDVFDHKIAMQELIGQIKAADCIGIVSCCYSNSLAYPTIVVLEQLARQGKEELKGKRIFAIAHGGMPYLDVHEHCILLCQCFANEMQMDYIGGAIRGLTPIINGEKLDEKNKMAKKIMKGLDLLVDDILNDRSISSKVQDIFNINIPSIVNYPLAAFMNHLQEKDRKAKGIINFDKQPYLYDKINS